MLISFCLLTLFSLGSFWVLKLLGGGTLCPKEPTASLFAKRRRITFITLLCWSGFVYQPYSAWAHFEYWNYWGRSTVPQKQNCFPNFKKLFSLWESSCISYITFPCNLITIINIFMCKTSTSKVTTTLCVPKAISERHGSSLVAFPAKLQASRAMLPPSSYEFEICMQHSCPKIMMNTMYNFCN